MRNSFVLLNAVAVVGASNPARVDRYRRFTFYIEASVITTGGTMKIQSFTPSGQWVDLDSRVISANGTTVVTVDGAFELLRANLSARTDGTYTVSMDAAS